MLVDGQIVHGEAVVALPPLLVIVGSGAFEARAEAEADVHGLTGPRREVKFAEVVCGEILPTVVRAEEVRAVIEARLGSPTVELFEQTLVVKSTPEGISGATGAGEQGLRGATDGAPSGFIAANFNDRQVVPHVVDDEAVGVCATKGPVAEVLEQLNAHEGPIGAGEVHVFEDHRVVPVLAVSGPQVAAAVGHGFTGPHEVPLVQVVGRDVRTVVAVGVARGANRAVRLQVPVGVAVHVLFIRPRAARATSRGILRTVPVIGVNRGVRGRCLVNDLQLDVHGGGTGVEGVHAGVRHGDVDLTAAFSGHAKPAVNRVDRKTGHGQIFVVHLNDRDGVVLSFPTEVVHPVAEVVGSVSNRDVRCGLRVAGQLTDRRHVGSTAALIGERVRVLVRTRRKGHLDGARVVQVERAGRTARRVRRVLLERNGGVDEIGVAVAVQVGHGQVIGDVRTEVRNLRRAPVPLRRGHRVGDVPNVTVGHGDDVSGAVVVKVGNVEAPEHGVHLDDGGVGRKGQRETRGRDCASVLEDGHVVAVAGAHRVAGGVIHTLAAQEEDVIVNARAEGLLFGFTVIADLKFAVAVGVCRTKICLLAAVSCTCSTCSGSAGHGFRTSDWSHVDLQVLGRNVRVEAEDGHVVIAVVVEVADLDVPTVEVRVPLADAETPSAVVFDDGEVARLAGRVARVVLLKRVIALINDDVKVGVAGEFTDLDELDVGEFVPIGVSAGV